MKKQETTIEQAAISDLAKEFFIKLGFMTIEKIFFDELPSIREIYKKVMKTAKIYYKNDTNELKKAQGYCKELIEYMEQTGFKFKTDVQPDELGQISQIDFEKIYSTIKSKFEVYDRQDNNKSKERIEMLLKKIFSCENEITIDNQNGDSLALNKDETLILRIVCGIYTKGKEQSLTQTAEILKEKKYKIRKTKIDENTIGMIFYETLGKISNYINQQNKIKKRLIGMNT